MYIIRDTGEYIRFYRNRMHSLQYKLCAVLYELIYLHCLMSYMKIIYVHFIEQWNLRCDCFIIMVNC